MKKLIMVEIETTFNKGIIKNTVDELTKKGIPNGCFQNYGAVAEVLDVLAQIEKSYDD